MANFNAAAKKTLTHEGGYQAILADRGNYNSRGELVGTNYGISAPMFEYYFQRTPTVADMKALSPDKALQIYKKIFWDAIKADTIKSQSVAEIIFDHSITSGTSAAGKILQRAVNLIIPNTLEVDGIVGAKTISAVNRVNAEDLFSKIKKLRQDFYISLNRPEFEKGWLSRVQKFVFEHTTVISVGLVAVITTIILLIANYRKS